MVIAWRSVVDGCVLICLLCRVFFKVRANRRVGKSKDPKTRVPEIAVPDLVSVLYSTHGHACMKQEEAPGTDMDDNGGISSSLPLPPRSLVTGEYQYSSSRRILVAEAVRTSRSNINFSSATGTDRSLPMPTRPLPHIPINEEEAHHVDVVHGEDSWEAKVLHVLHSKTCQYTLMGLLLLDVVILFVELFLGAQYPACTFIIRDAISCCPKTFDSNAQDEHRLLGEASSLTCETGGIETGDLHMFRSLAEVASDEGHHSVCEAGVDTPQCQAGCDPHKYDGVHTAHTALFSRQSQS